MTSPTLRYTLLNFMDRPPRSAFSANELRQIDRLDTPFKVQKFLSAMPYNWEKGGGTLRTFRQVLKLNSGHCLEAALSAAVIMEQHRYPPLLLSIASKDKLDHVVFVFKIRGKWGSIARSRDVGLHGRRPVFRSLRDLTWSYFDPYVDMTGRIIGYGLADLRNLGSYDWRFARNNVWKIERYLNEIPHKQIVSSDRRYARLLARYKAWKSAHPDRPLVDYPHRERWMI
jgi:hypothetical protein